MAEGHDPNKRAKDVGSDSPASREAKEQTKSGMEGAARGEGEKGGTNRQPSQSSERSGRGPKDYATKGFEDENRPSEQGEGSRSAGSVGESESLRGEGRGRSGSRSSGGDHGGDHGGERGEDEATVHEK